MKHDPFADLAHEASDLGVPLSQAQTRCLLEFERALLEWAIPAGMVAKADAPRVRERHILDCLRAAAVVGLSDRSGYDLGSGAGLPGIAIAIACPSMEMTLVETRRRRVAFLELAVERLRLGNVRVVAARIEEMSDRADLCFTRALAPLPQAWAFAEPLLSTRGRLVFFAGGVSGGVPAPPGGRVVEVLSSPMLERAGPLVIIARQ